MLYRPITLFGMSTTAPKQSCRSGLLFGVVSATVILLACLVLVCLPNFVRSGTSKTHRIITNLKQLDGAKQEWALVHSRTVAVEVAKEDIADYVGARPHKGWVQPVDGERYVLNLLTESPEAELTRPVDGRPAGTRIRLLPYGVPFSVGPLNKTNWACEIILPKSAVSNAALPHR